MVSANEYLLPKKISVEKIPDLDILLKMESKIILYNQSRDHSQESSANEEILISMTFP